MITSTTQNYFNDFFKEKNRKIKNYFTKIKEGEERFELSFLVV
jgi:hypothetical protein